MCKIAGPYVFGLGDRIEYTTPSIFIQYQTALFARLAHGETGYETYLVG